MPPALFQNGRALVAVIAASTAAWPQSAAGSADDVPLRELDVSTKMRTRGDDDAHVQSTYGDGVGRYRGDLTAAPADGDLEAITVFGHLVGHEHHGSDAYRSTLSYSRAEGDIPDVASADTNEQIDYLALDLIWIWQFADRVRTGIESLHGSRETVDDNDGEANRIQISMRFDL
jgi:hypothetical protein